jgi:CRISPR-associated protein Csm4
MSDTMFGHFCWSIRYQAGEESLERFLKGYDEDSPAPVLFSSAFLTGYIPRPTLPHLGREQSLAFAKRHFGTGKASIFEGLSKIKSWNKLRLISIEHWKALKDNYDDEALYELLQNGEIGEEGKPLTELSSHNVISRETGTVSSEGGGLFTREKTWYDSKISLDIYVLINDSAMETMVDNFLTQYLPQNGFGADKSLGMGAFDICRDKGFDPSDFEVASANARMSLSLAAFPDMGNYPAFYRLKTKFGRLGGDFSVASPTGGATRPFKKPVLMYEEGAVFIGHHALHTMPLLSDVHSDTRIRHCGIPVTLPLSTREDLYHV